jgi:hypothetical protein
MASKKQSKSLRKGKKVEHTKTLALRAGWDVKANQKV